MRESCPWAGDTHCSCWKVMARLGHDLGWVLTQQGHGLDMRPWIGVSNTDGHDHENHGHDQYGQGR